MLDECADRGLLSLTKPFGEAKPTIISQAPASHPVGSRDGFFVCSNAAAVDGLRLEPGWLRWFPAGGRPTTGPLEETSDT